MRNGYECISINTPSEKYQSIYGKTTSMLYKIGGNICVKN